MASASQAAFVAIAAVVTLCYSGKGPLLMRKMTEVIHGKPGCSPVGSIGNVTIHYFSIRGRAEAIRMLLKLADVPFSEINFDSDTWPEHKAKGIKSGVYTFGQVPAIETTTGLKLAQSQAILHYIGRATGMECDCEDLHMCEVIALGVEDAVSKLSKMLYDPNFSLRDRHVYLIEVMPVWLAYFEQLAAPISNQDAPYFASGRLTWVDVLVFDLLENNIEFSRFDFKTPQLIQRDPIGVLPRLANFYNHMRKLPRLKSYLNSKKRFPFEVEYMPKDALSSAENS